MNILFFVGNGFDLNIGLATRYSDFYKHYLALDSPNKNVEKLKKDLKINGANWSDMELELGKFTSKIQTKEEFDTIYEDFKRIQFLFFFF